MHQENWVRHAIFFSSKFCCTVQLEDVNPPTRSSSAGMPDAIVILVAKQAALTAGMLDAIVIVIAVVSRAAFTAGRTRL